MLNKRIIYSTVEGGVAIIIPTGTVEECIKDVPEGVQYRIIGTTEIPTDRTFRNAWEFTV